MPSPTGRPARLAHVGIAVRALHELRGLYRDVLQLPDVELDDADGAAILGFQAGEPLIELLEAIEPGSPIDRFIQRRGPGIHHICFAVDDLGAALDRCRAAGVRLIDQTPRIGAEGKPIAFLHPASTGGVLIELTEE